MQKVITIFYKMPRVSATRADWRIAEFQATIIASHRRTSWVWTEFGNAFWIRTIFTHNSPI